MSIVPAVLGGVDGDGGGFDDEVDGGCGREPEVG